MVGGLNGDDLLSLKSECDSLRFPTTGTTIHAEPKSSRFLASYVVTCAASQPRGT